MDETYLDESPRLILTELEVGNPVVATLDVRGREYVGDAPLESEDDVGPAAARAVLAALDRLTPSSVSFRLDWYEAVNAGEELPAAVLVMVTVELAGVEMTETGSAIIRSGDAWAAARAVLSALNRRLEIMEIF